MNIHTKTKERNQTIVKLLDESYPPLTLQEVGDMYGVSRERIRQIYKRATGRGAGERMVLRREIKNEVKGQVEKAKLESVKFHCRACNKPVMHKEGKYHLCVKCSDMLTKRQRDPYTLLQCIVCGDDFHPFRNNPNGKYCSTDCYFNSGNVGRPPKLLG